MLSPRARPLAPPGPRVGTHTEGRGQAARERREGVRPPLPEPPPPPPPGLALLLPEPPAAPSVSFPKPARVRRPRCRAQVPPYGQRSLMTSRGSQLPPPGLVLAPGKTSRVLARPTPRPGRSRAPARKSQSGKNAKAKAANYLFFRLWGRKTNIKIKRARCRRQTSSRLISLLSSYYRLRTSLRR